MNWIDEKKNEYKNVIDTDDDGVGQAWVGEVLQEAFNRGANSEGAYKQTFNEVQEPFVEEIMQDLKNEVYILTKVDGGLYKAMQGDALLERFRTTLTTLQQKHQEDIDKALERGRLSALEEARTQGVEEALAKVEEWAWNEHEKAIVEQDKNDEDVSGVVYNSLNGRLIAFSDTLDHLQQLKDNKEV